MYLRVMNLLFVAFSVLYSQLKEENTKKTVKMFCNESVLDPAVEEKEPCLITS